MKKFVSLCILILWIKAGLVIAKDLNPVCPQTPIKAFIGEYLPNNWKIWKTYEKYSWWKGFKYAHFKETYQIEKWDDTFEGHFSITPKQTRYYIACCKHNKGEDFFLCAMKEMDNIRYCDTPSIKYGHEKPIFNCFPLKTTNHKIS